MKFFIKLILFFFCCICFSEKKAENYYEIFGVPQDATAEELHAAYRRKAKEYHPDKYTDPKKKEIANKMMQQLNDWYDVLKDPQQRRLYDEYLRETASDYERDFKTWRDKRRNRGYGGASSSARNSANGGANSSSNRSHQSAGNKSYGGANSSSKRSRSSSQNSSHQNQRYNGTKLHHSINLEDSAKAYRFVNILLKTGAFPININAKDSNGDTALTLAVKQIFSGKKMFRMYRMKIINLILSVEGLNINAKNNKGDTALALAVAMNSDRAVLLLLSAGADPNIPGSDGHLLHALLSNMENRKSQEGRMYYNSIPRQILKKGRNSSLYILLYLQQYGIDVAYKNSSSLTPFHFSLLNRFFYYSLAKTFKAEWQVRSATNYTKRLIDFLIRNGFADYLINNPQERETIDSLLIQRGFLDEFRLLGRHLERKRSAGNNNPPETRFFDRCYAVFNQLAAKWKR